MLKNPLRRKCRSITYTKVYRKIEESHLVIIMLLLTKRMQCNTIGGLENKDKTRKYDKRVEDVQAH